MPSYKIERWDPIIPTGHSLPLPMIYIKPDNQFFKLAQDNLYNVIVTISGTGKLYDTKPMIGIIDSSAYYPNYRPNFFNDTKLIVITLMCDWIGYGELGTACIHGYTGPDKVTIQPKPYEPPKPLPWKWNMQEDYTPSHQSYKNMNNKQILIALSFLLIILIGVVIYSYNKSRGKIQ